MSNVGIMNTLSDPSISLSKFDVGERQLHQAVLLFFRGEDAVSVHTLSEAAFQVLYDIRGSFGASSILRDNERIRPDKKSEWLSILSRSRNFFKHANRDKHDVHEFRDSFNHFSLLDCVNLHVSIKKRWTPETFLYAVWFGLRYPDLLLEDDAMSTTLQALRSQGRAPDVNRLSSFYTGITELRSGTFVLGNVVTFAGLSE